MGKENSPRRRIGSGQDGIGSRTAVVSVAAAVVLVAGGGWAVAQAGNGDPSTGAGAPTTTAPTTAAASAPTQSPTHQPSHHQKSWSKQCGRAATAAARAGVGVLAPSELPTGWSLVGCRFSAATGWHLVVKADGRTLAVDQRKGDVAPVVTAVLGAGSHQGKDVHAAGTGTWQSWTGSGGRHALSRGLTSSGVVLSGAVDVSTLNRFAGALMTYETAPSGNNGG